MEFGFFGYCCYGFFSGFYYCYLIVSSLCFFLIIFKIRGNLVLNFVYGLKIFMLVVRDLFYNYKEENYGIFS